MLKEVLIYLMSGFIKLKRNSKNFEELYKRRPSALLLLMLVAYRAKRTNDTNFNDLEIGEALIGDYKNYGVTEQIYRTDKNYLTTFGFITIKPTNRGTVAKLVDTSIFDINPEPINGQLTINQRTTNDQLTTNKNVKNVKNEKKDIKKKLHKKKISEPKPLTLEDFKKISLSFDRKGYTIRPTEAEVEETDPTTITVEDYYEKVLDYAKASGKKYQDYSSAVRNFIRRDIEAKKIPKNIWANW